MTSFNFEDALKQLQSGKKLIGTDGILTPLIKQLTEAALQAELSDYLEQSNEQLNCKNGYTRKTMKTGSGSFELDTPRDRAGTFEPQLVKKNQTQLSDEIDSKILSLFCKRPTASPFLSHSIMPVERRMTIAATTHQYDGSAKSVISQA